LHLSALDCTEFREKVSPTSCGFSRESPENRLEEVPQLVDHLGQISWRLYERGAVEKRPPLSLLARIVTELH